jgi:predicted transcriptional regulator
MAFSTHDGAPPPAATRLFPWIGPVANIFAGVLIGAASYALVPQINLIAQPWIAITHILRSVVWMQIILGGVSLLPLPNLPGGSAAASDEPVTGPAKGRATFKLQLPQLGLGTALAIVMILSGLILMNLFLIILGGFMLLGAQIATAHQANSTAGAETILVREVMLTEYTLLSSSDTLQGALDRTVHSLQDVFPVVRGNQLVGSIARQTIAARLFTEGDSYLQGIMSRSLQLTAPTDKLVEALRRASTFGASEFIPVVDDGCLIGILTPQSLSRAVQQVKLLHARTKATERERERD